jgi:predicted nucleic acid-binding protein
MILLVNDANILIDLLKIDLLALFFQLRYEFHVTDMVADEVREENAGVMQGFLDDGTLKKKNFTYEELWQIQLLMLRHKGLSIKDCSCLFQSKALNARLITGDALLRKTAEQDQIKVHGILWVFDQLINEDLLTTALAREKLSRLVSLNARLPAAECKKRLKLWK